MEQYPTRKIAEHRLWYGNDFHPEHADEPVSKSTLSTWSGVDRETLTTFAVYVAGMWTSWAITAPSLAATHRAQLASHYASWRLK